MDTGDCRRPFYSFLSGNSNLAEISLRRVFIHNTSGMLSILVKISTTTYEAITRHHPEDRVHYGDKRAGQSASHRMRPRMHRTTRPLGFSLQAYSHFLRLRLYRRQAPTLYNVPRRQDVRNTVFEQPSGWSLKQLLTCRNMTLAVVTGYVLGKQKIHNLATGSNCQVIVKNTSCTTCYTGCAANAAVYHPNSSTSAYRHHVASLVV